VVGRDRARVGSIDLKVARLIRSNLCRGVGCEEERDQSKQESWEIFHFHHRKDVNRREVIGRSVQKHRRNNRHGEERKSITFRGAKNHLQLNVNDKTPF